MVSTLVTQDLDFSGEEDLGVAAVAVERRVRDAEAWRYRDQPRRAARLRCRLPVSKYHHLGLEVPPPVSRRTTICVSARPTSSLAADE